MTLQNKLIYLRENAGLTQEEIAKKLNMSKSSYCRKEKGHNEFSIEEFDKLLSIFNVSYSDIFDLEFPIMREENISDDLLDQLEESIKRNKLVSNDWNENKVRYDNIQKALKPVIDERIKLFNFPDFNLNDVERGTTVKVVKLNIRAERLVNEAIYAQGELTHKLFGANKL